MRTREHLTQGRTTQESDAGPGDIGARCTTNDDCAMSAESPEFCDGYGCSARGGCQPRPSGCSQDPSPVCGCDGVTYENSCLANEAGARVLAGYPCDGGAPDDGGTAHDAGVPGDGGQCQTWSPLPCGAIEACHCGDGSTQLAGCAGPPTCNDACCGHGGAAGP